MKAIIKQSISASQIQITLEVKYPQYDTFSTTVKKLLISCIITRNYQKIESGGKN